MKKIVSLLFLVFITTGCPIDVDYSMWFYNSSQFDSLYCIFDRYTYDNAISPTSKIDYVDCEYKPVFGDSRDWKKSILDSIAIYIIDANQIELNWGRLNPLTKEEIERIVPSYVLAEYHFSKEEILDLEGNLRFPPNDQMKSIWMRPSYESLQKYSKR